MRKLMMALAVMAASVFATPAFAHGGGLNSCGCHFNRKTGECHCHRPNGTCGCSCQPSSCGGSGRTSMSDGASSPFVLCNDRVRVRGYDKKDGTHVEPHYRTSPNETKNDNWSTKGNVNPYTGEKGTKDPYPTPKYDYGSQKKADRNAYDAL